MASGEKLVCSLLTVFSNAIKAFGHAFKLFNHVSKMFSHAFNKCSVKGVVQ